MIYSIEKIDAKMKLFLRTWSCFLVVIRYYLF